MVTQTFPTSAFSSSAPLSTPLPPPTPTQSFPPSDSHNATPWQDLGEHVQSQTSPNFSNVYLTAELDSQSRAQRTSHAPERDGQQAVPQNTEPEIDDEAHFIGHTNPQGIFLAATSPTTSVASGGGDKVGFWMPRNSYEHIKRHRNQTSSRKSKTLYTQDRLVSNVLLPWLLDQSLRLLPDQESFAALQKIYKTEVHPIFPVVDFDMPLAASTTTDVSPSKILLMQAVCLAAAPSPRARPHLKLPLLSESVQNPTDFISYLSQAILTSLDLGTSRDKLVAVQAFSVLSLFSQLSNDNHSSAEHCARAVSYVQTMQLHLDTSKFRKDHNVATRLFLSVWALDRLNAAFHGRPVLMQERDFGRDMMSSVHQQDSCFQLFLVVVEHLDRIIDLYRPSTGTPNDWMDDFPSFEDLIIRAGSQRVPGYLIGKFYADSSAFLELKSSMSAVQLLTITYAATVEVLYHAVVMLSCRFNSLDEPDRSSPASARQNFAASRVIAIVGSEFSEDIVLLPFVPYAVSLCLRVSYRELRLSKVPLLRARSRRQLLTTCALLRRFSTFGSAETMADLAEQTVREMDKVAASLIPGRRQSIPESQSPRYREVGERPSFSAHAHVTSQAPNRVLEPNAHIDGSSTSTQNIEIEQAPLAFDHHDLSSFNFDLDFADLPDIDLFEHFDPSFKLPAVDAALAQNADLSTFAEAGFWSEANFTPPAGLSSLH